MEKSMTELLLEWQALGEHQCFACLAREASPLIEKVAATWLKRRHLFSAVTLDEIGSRVLDHLRRLYVHAESERPVARFRHEPDGDETAGVRYVCWLTRRRTQDVVRKERRRIRRQPTFTEVGMDFTKSTHARNGAEPQGERTDAMRVAVESLRPVDRQVVEGMLDGQSQREMALQLGVSEGTISRHKAVAVAKLRCLLGTSPAPRRPKGRRAAAGSPDGGDTPMAPTLPLVTVQYQVSRDSRSVLQRRYKWYAFGCLMEGAAGLTWVRKGRQQESRQALGTCNFFVPDDATNEFLLDPSPASTFHIVLVAPEVLEDAVAIEGGRGASHLRPLFGFRDHVIESTIRSMMRFKETGDELAHECIAYSLVLRVLECQGYGKAAWKKDRSVFAAREARQLCEYIDAHVRARITLKQLAEVQGLSPGHFSRKCRRSFGVTPSRLVTMRRVQRVLDLVQSTNQPLERIARVAGFCSPSHCTNAFRSIVGMPPSRFRAEERGTRSRGSWSASGR